MSIYGPYEETLNNILADVERRLAEWNNYQLAANQPKMYEHLIGRVKTPASMAEKCRRKGYPETTTAALRQCRDAVGVRLVCNFISDITRCLSLIEQADWCTVVKKKGLHHQCQTQRELHPVK